ncbi:MAG: sialidase family protein [Verrucomicrobia bacterium]|nr:sialidase family protein [Verrucomicrobiota bacterium]
MSLRTLLCLAVILAGCSSPKQTSKPGSPAQLLPAGWDAKAEGDKVMAGLIKTTAPEVKGAHDAHLAIVGDRAFVISEVNERQPSENASWSFIYSSVSIIDLRTRQVLDVLTVARSEQAFANETLPVGSCFVPRIKQVGPQTLRCWFASEQPGKRQSQTYFRDLDLRTLTFEKEIHRMKLQTSDGTFDLQPKYLYADAAKQGFKRKPVDAGLYLFDNFKEFDGQTYIAINNYLGAQEALCTLNTDADTLTVVGHFNGPGEPALTEPAVNRLPDGTWLAISRKENGDRNYWFSESKDGKTWTTGGEKDFVKNGAASKPTFDKFHGVYYLGWQERTTIEKVGRSVFNIDVSNDGKHWERKYRFETTKSFQYPTFVESNGQVWLCVTQGDTDPSRKERIMFGRLE